MYMYIYLPDGNNHANHFCPQDFLSEQRFPSFSMSCFSGDLAASGVSHNLAECPVVRASFFQVLK